MGLYITHFLWMFFEGETAIITFEEKGTQISRIFWTSPHLHFHFAFLEVVKYFNNRAQWSFPSSPSLASVHVYSNMDNCNPRSDPHLFVSMTTLQCVQMLRADWHGTGLPFVRITRTHVFMKFSQCFLERSTWWFFIIQLSYLLTGDTD